MALMSGRRHSASRKVVGFGRFGSRPWERGKSSYQAPKRARSRSTTSGSSAERVAKRRSGWRRMAVSRSSATRIETLVAADLARRSASSADPMVVVSFRARAERARSSAASSNSRPSAISTGTATPASSFFSRPWRQLPKASRQASTA